MTGNLFEQDRTAYIVRNFWSDGVFHIKPRVLSSDYEFRVYDSVEEAIQHAEELGLVVVLEDDGHVDPLTRILGGLVTTDDLAAGVRDE